MFIQGSYEDSKKCLHTHVRSSKNASSFLKSPSNEVYKYSSDTSPRPSNGRDKINNYSSIPSKLKWLIYSREPWKLNMSIKMVNLFSRRSRGHLSQSTKNSPHHPHGQKLPCCCANDSFECGYKEGTKQPYIGWITQLRRKIQVASANKFRNQKKI